jgi:diacylglycerol kinase (ATP)
MPRATLIHNVSAGDGRPTGGELRELARRHGFVLEYVTTEDDIDAALQDPGDLVAIAGGDGTIGEVAFRLLGRDIPMAILPLGTANNLALSLGIAGAVDRLVGEWKDSAIRPLNFGLVHGPWGVRPMIESFGLGAFAHAMPVLSALKRGGTPPPTREAALRQDRDALKRILADFVPRSVQARIDGSPLEGDDFLMIEVMNGPILGPRLRLAPHADPGDGRFDVVVVREADRDNVVHWIERDACADPRLTVRPAVLFELTWKGDPLHIDGETWAADDAALGSIRTVPVDEPSTVRVELAPATIPLLVPRHALRGGSG